MPERRQFPYPCERFDAVARSVPPPPETNPRAAVMGTIGGQSPLRLSAFRCIGTDPEAALMQIFISLRRDRPCPLDRCRKRVALAVQS